MLLFLLGAKHNDNRLIRFDSDDDESLATVEELYNVFRRMRQQR